MQHRDLVNSSTVKSIRSRLLRWYRIEQRDLPWRRTRDPYRIWLSEVMLQQTTVRTVTPRYGAFLELFPDLPTLASASEDEVLAAWSGLGYYSRARSFHRAARIVVNDHNGEVPSEPSLFRALPGVGPYTAGAVLSIAFDAPEPLVDGNVARLLSRLFAITGDPASGSVKGRLWELAAALLPARLPGEFNQALMEFGALVCTPKNPLCDECPLRRTCGALARDLVPAIPARKKAAPVKKVLLAAALVERGGRILLVRRPSEESLLAGLWLFPGGTVRSPDAAPRYLERLVRRLLGGSIEVERKPAMSIPHSITCHRITMLVHRVRQQSRSRQGEGAAAGKADKENPALRWISPDRIGSLPVSSLVTKVIGKDRRIGNPGQ